MQGSDTKPFYQRAVEGRYGLELESGVFLHSAGLLCVEDGRGWPARGREQSEDDKDNRVMPNDATDYSHWGLAAPGGAYYEINDNLLFHAGYYFGEWNTCLQHASGRYNGICRDA